MKIPKINIPQIQIKEIDIPQIRIWELQRPTLDIIYKPVVDIPACVDAHRNNLPSLIGEDEKVHIKPVGRLIYLVLNLWNIILTILFTQPP